MAVVLDQIVTHARRDHGAAGQVAASPHDGAAVIEVIPRRANHGQRRGSAWRQECGARRGPHLGLRAAARSQYAAQREQDKSWNRSMRHAFSFSM